MFLNWSQLSQETTLSTSVLINFWFVIWLRILESSHMSSLQIRHTWSGLVCDKKYSLTQAIWNFFDLLRYWLARKSQINNQEPRVDSLKNTSLTRGSSLLGFFAKWTRLAKTRQSHLGLNKSWQTINFRCESRWYLSSRIHRREVKALYRLRRRFQAAPSSKEDSEVFLSHFVGELFT
jgi:hypothetical protein